ncbi:MAG: hypothetical protein AAGI68_11855 [Planctomycetota bacterium]
MIGAAEVDEQSVRGVGLFADMGRQSRTREPLWVRFERFDDQHPEVYRAFCRIVEQLLQRRRTHYSADAILHVIRYETAISGADVEPYKINNDYAAFYARKWLAEHPAHPAFFALRKQKAVSGAGVRGGAA